MKKDCLIAFGSLAFILLLSCQKENGILPANAKLKQVLLFNNLNQKEPIDTVEEYEYSHRTISKVTTKYGYNIYDYNSVGELSEITEYTENLNSPSGYIILKIFSYFYSNEGKKVKETIEYPQINTTEYNLFYYTGGRLSKIENYGYSDALVGYTMYEFDDYGQPVKEVLYLSNNVPYGWTINSFSKGLMVESEIYTDENLENKVRTFKRTYDVNKNLKILETFQGPASTQFGNFVYRYIYYGE
jgi:hypothetical protein